LARNNFGSNKTFAFLAMQHLASLTGNIRPARARLSATEQAGHTEDAKS
jgi:hypothetical protein